MIRYKLSPLYLEKRILDEIVGSTKTYLFQFVKELKKKVDDEKKRCVESYLTWSIEYYNKNASDNEKLLDEFENKIKNITSDNFLGIDLSKTNTVLDTLYPDILPSSEIRETLWVQWLQIKEKHD
jgi:exoribonuclease II